MAARGISFGESRRERHCFVRGQNPRSSGRLCVYAKHRQRSLRKRQHRIGRGVVGIEGNRLLRGGGGAKISLDGVAVIKVLAEKILLIGRSAGRAVLIDYAFA